MPVEAALRRTPSTGRSTGTPSRPFRATACRLRRSRNSGRPHIRRTASHRGIDLHSRTEVKVASVGVPFGLLRVHGGTGGPGTETFHVSRLDGKTPMVKLWPNDSGVGCRPTVTDLCGTDSGSRTEIKPMNTFPGF